MGTGLKYKCIEHSPAWMFFDVAIPIDADFFSFDFQFAELGDGDWLTVFFGDELLFSFLGEHFGGDGFMHTDIPLGDLAGKVGTLLFRLNSVGEPNAELELANIGFTRLTSVPEPATLALVGLGLILLASNNWRRLDAPCSV